MTDLYNFEFQSIGLINGREYGVRTRDDLSLFWVSWPLKSGGTLEIKRLGDGGKGLRGEMERSI